eukprot:Tbor_TRINITY_DN2923_c0_g1::TRINITY_DN2923_c0_g1_i2::g.1054::m.1054/K14399/CLP1, HERB; polyribonucleotide 5'-hydroxyl-kinase
MSIELIDRVSLQLSEETEVAVYFLSEHAHRLAFSNGGKHDINWEESRGKIVCQSGVALINGSEVLGINKGYYWPISPRSSPSPQSTVSYWTRSPFEVVLLSTPSYSSASVIITKAVYVSQCRPSDGSLNRITAELERHRIRTAIQTSSSLLANGACNDSNSPHFANGPCVAVIGGPSQGRTALCRALISAYLCSSSVCVDPSIHPICMVSTDISGGSVTKEALLPGTISAVFLDSNWTLSPVSQPLSYFFGALEVSASNINRYFDCCAYMTQSLEVLRTSKGSGTNNKNMKIGGTIIDTLSIPRDATSDVEYLAVRGALELFHVNYIVIIGDGSLESEKNLLRRLQSDIVSVQPAVQIFYFKSMHEFTLPTLSISSLPTLSPSMSAAYSYNNYFTGGALTKQNIMQLKEERQCGPLIAAYLQTVELEGLLFLDAMTFEIISRPSHETIPKNCIAALPFHCKLDGVPAANVSGYVVIKDIGDRVALLLCPAPGPLPVSVLLVSREIRGTDAQVVSAAV